MREPRFAVIGAGISGLTTALELLELTRDTDATVTVFDAAPQPGGKIRTSPFAGLDHVDEGADAFLARVPEAVALAGRVGLGDDLVSPEPVGAAVWHDGLHRIPDGLVLGLPGKLRPLATTGLLSWRGKARAAVEPLLPRTPTTDDSIGAFVRARFGDEVHERLVDSLVGSIYAADTDRFSLAEVPQLAGLARSERSVLLAARRQRQQAGTATAAASPVFAAPCAGMAALTDATAGAVAAAGGRFRHATTVDELEPDADGRWRIVTVDGTDTATATTTTTDTTADAVVIAAPAATAAAILPSDSGDAADLLRRGETADVIMVTLHVDAAQWPDRLRGMSGYLVPKPAQRLVTAVSFGSQKWGHWRPPGGGEILRVSLGRDGLPVMHLDDDEVLDAVLTDLDTHLDVSFAPSEVRITRWPGAFAQYRPHHADWVAGIDDALPSGVFVAGAAYRGIGIPACVRGAAATARRAVAHTDDLADSMR